MSRRVPRLPGATRNGRPAHENAPARRRGDMREWLAQREIEREMPAPFSVLLACALKRKLPFGRAGR